MSTPKNNGKGIAGNTTPQNNKTTNNGKTVTPAKVETALKAEEQPKAEEKPAPVIVDINAAKPQSKTLEEQIQYFLGLEKLVNIRRRFETHLEAVEALEIDEEDLTKFETGNNYGVRIELHDSKKREYNITNPRLVKELQAHLVGLLENKITEYDSKILAYGTGRQ